ncbi:LexA/Signal peptidase [Marasmius fiardii PR-910]|nr:LexA/Signal peptidase [Marasmius fiardii PR-910]
MVRLRWVLEKFMELRAPKRTARIAAFRGLQFLNLFCAIHLFTDYVGGPYTMEGPSMLPTLANEGEIVIEDRLTYRLWPNSFARGDLLVLKSPLDPNRIICKRVIGLPGDTICVDPTGEKAPSTEHVVVPKGHIWISGDNAAYSRDSREYGPVPMALVHGRLYARVWPLKAATIFRSNARVLK